jgi:hypothetical protein
MGRLTPRERECLSHLAGKACEPLRACDDEGLRHFLSRGPIGETAGVRVPLPLFRRSFLLTVIGRAALDQDD